MRVQSEPIECLGQDPATLEQVAAAENRRFASR
jgi:hypothetical protein